MTLPDLGQRLPEVAEALLGLARTALGPTCPERSYLTLGIAPEAVYEEYGDVRGDTLSVRVLRCYPGTPAAATTGRPADYCSVDLTLELRLSLWRLVGAQADAGAYDVELLDPADLTEHTVLLLRDLGALQAALVAATGQRNPLGGQEALAGPIEPERGSVLAGWRVDVRVAL